MNNAPAFFDACVGVFLLVGACSLGVNAASGQSGLLVEVGDAYGAHASELLAAGGRAIYRGNLDGASKPFFSPVPGTSRIVAVSSALFGTWLVLLEDGDCYQCNGEGTK